MPAHLGPESFSKPSGCAAVLRCGCLAASLVAAGAAAELEPATLAAFDHYVRQAERAAEERARTPQRFLWVEESSERSAAGRRAPVVAPPETGALREIPGGLVHHWIGAVFVPGASVAQALALLEDYDRHARFYAPEVAASKLLSRNGNDFRIYYRLLKKKVITVVLDTEHEVHYTRLDDKRWESRSYSTRIVEVENAGKADERRLPPGRDSGFLWRLNSYWRLAGRVGGLWIECEAISLTRDIPPGLGWLVKPVVQDLPRESLAATLRNTRNALVR